MKHLVKIGLVIAFGLAAAGVSAFGQSQSLCAKVPFDFAAGTLELKAGNYCLYNAFLNTGTTVLRIRGDENGQGAFLPVRFPIQRNRKADPELAFYCIDHRCTLEKVYSTSGQGWAVAVPPMAPHGKLIQASIRLGAPR
jgi:hypothetical protein